MFDIVLFQPEIPPNTGNVIRLAANTGCTLHLVKPLGFALEDSKLKRAGLDYHEYAAVHVHDNWQALQAALPGRRMFAMTTKGSSRFDTLQFKAGDVLIFGQETRGLPDEVLLQFDAAHRIRLPMRAGQRSLNLSNAVAITVFEGWRQLGYAGGA
ncbi:tRNA (cytidine(34)-2'-O)-methyltransferase [Andreprevotia sp. IGB-42]|uniref:tRNA (cytidine(34)-2'-O)-methyltransferase n=1 Tax=Andreprevotia sp. IGB-42 TaxID=2497473 RepID=UPI001359EFFD|nr:tRNA (cytidine(34)-2'-O)-methyltransferase [Andreprevotia sp. IGB-42]KAF0814306.1 tRNA (cytidine(34)-2'-O)-methyltransferase [Andreprevotia sp. IGB-42]